MNISEIIFLVSAIQCWRCSYNDLKTDTWIPDALENLILDQFRTTSDVNCAMDDFVHDQYKVHLRICPDAKDDQHIYKCATFKGRSTGHVLGGECKFYLLQNEVNSKFYDRRMTY